MGSFNLDCFRYNVVGDGGDELFGGYDYYRYFYIASKLGLPIELNYLKPLYETGVGSAIASKIDWKIGKGLRILSYPYDPAIYATTLYGVMPAKELRGLRNGTCAANHIMSDLYTEHKFDYRYTLSNMLQIDQTLLLAENYNYKSDKSSSAYSLEERVPLQSFPLVDYVNSGPMRQKIGVFHGKKPLRKILKKYIPELSNKPKRGYGTPSESWLKCGSDMLESSIDNLLTIKALDRDMLLRLYSNFNNKHSSVSEARLLWNALVVGCSLSSYKYV